MVRLMPRRLWDFLPLSASSEPVRDFIPQKHHSSCPVCFSLSYSVHLSLSLRCARTTNFNKEQWNDFTCTERVSGRYVTVSFPGTRPLILCEVKIYGKKRGTRNVLIRSPSVSWWRSTQTFPLQWKCFHLTLFVSISSSFISWNLKEHCVIFVEENSNSELHSDNINEVIIQIEVNIIKLFSVENKVPRTLFCI